MHTLPNLPPSIAHQVFAELCASLPPPVTDSATARAAREDLARAAVAALYPADAFEALLAAQIVAADFHAKDSLRAAMLPGTPPEDIRRGRAQASAMMRHMQSGLRTLQHRQATREKAEAAMHPAAMERAGWWFHDVSTPLPPPAAPAPTPPAAEPDDDKFRALSPAEQYAVIYPDRAALIRAERGLPARCSFGPPDDEIVEALVNGTSPILRALDNSPPRANVSPAELPSHAMAK
jgi:hypothetical protein